MILIYCFANSVRYAMVAAAWNQGQSEIGVSPPASQHPMYCHEFKLRQVKCRLESAIAKQVSRPYTKLLDLFISIVLIWYDFLPWFGFAQFPKTFQSNHELIWVLKLKITADDGESDVMKYERSESLRFKVQTCYERCSSAILAAAAARLH